MLSKKMSNAGVKGRNSTGTVTAPQLASTSKMNAVSAAAALQQSGALPIPPAIVEPQQPVGLTHIKSSENAKMVPRYTAALARPEDESLPSDDLDAVQLELEMLLSAVALRYRNMKDELESLDKEDVKKKKNDKQSTTPNPSNSGKRKREDGGKKGKLNAQQIKLTKLKNAVANSPVHSQHTDDSMDGGAGSASNVHGTGTIDGSAAKILVPKNDVPNKFWLSVEPYCMPITQEDIRLLDDLIEEYDDPLVPPIPELGPHYITAWAAEDLKDEQDNSNQNAKANKRFTNAANPDVVSMLKRGERMIGDGVTGPLTQRLISALMEENIMSNEIDKSPESHATESNDSNSENNSTPLTSMLRNGIEVEKRLKQELLDLGILDIRDFPVEKEDEVLNEIKRVRTELHAIAEYNQSELKALHAAAKQEMKRLEIKRKLDFVDQEIMELYRKVWTVRQKRRPLTDEERADLYRLTAEQTRLSDELESMPMPGFSSFMCSSSS